MTRIVATLGNMFSKLFSAKSKPEIVIDGGVLLDQRGVVVCGGYRTYRATYNPNNGKVVYVWWYPCGVLGNHVSAHAKTVKVQIEAGLTEAKLQARIESSQYLTASGVNNTGHGMFPLANTMACLDFVM